MREFGIVLARRMVAIRVSDVCLVDVSALEEADCCDRIGDQAAPRAPFQIIITLCATPRFMLLAAQWLIHRTRTNTEPQKNRESTGNSTAVDQDAPTTRRAAKAAEAVEDVLNSLEKAVKTEERVTGSSTADVELYVGIARTFCW